MKDKLIVSCPLPSERIPKYLDAITVTSKVQHSELGKVLDQFHFNWSFMQQSWWANTRRYRTTQIVVWSQLVAQPFADQIPPSLGKLSKLESLDLSSNKLTGEIPMQLADGLIFLLVLNPSFHQLIGPIPYVKQFATHLEAFLWREQRIVWVSFEEGMYIYRTEVATSNIWRLSLKIWAFDWLEFPEVQNWDLFFVFG